MAIRIHLRAKKRLVRHGKSLLKTRQTLLDLVVFTPIFLDLGASERGRLFRVYAPGCPFPD